MLKEKSTTWSFITSRLGVICSRLPLPPNFYTWFTLVPALGGMVAIIQGSIWLGVLLFLLSGLLDLIDGEVARRLNKTSAYGAFLDGSLDRFVDLMLIFSYFWLPIETPWLNLGQWLCLAIFFAVMPSFEVAYANHRKAVHDPDETIIWRILNRDEMFFMMLLIPIVAKYSSVWSGYLLLALVFLSIVTTLQTLYLTWRIAGKSARS
jgi:CDP-diacylglycerol--glycerol-3-phosphate 3-phosphatidyltransferase